jgi:hypothetical protein
MESALHEKTALTGGFLSTIYAHTTLKLPEMPVKNGN